MNLEMNTRNYSRHFLCRCIADFNKIYEYPLLSFFTWNMLDLACILVTLQFELVEFIFDTVWEYLAILFSHIQSQSCNLYFVFFSSLFI